MEAIILVVGVSLIGFWEWRLALIMALAIPITLAMTFGVTYMLGIDLQQVSVATLIIALGLLVDVPVVAGDGIKRGLAEGLPRRVAAWLGPTKLATAIFYATLTNIIAYLPFLYAQREHRRVSQEPPHRHDYGVALCVGGCHDVRSAAGLLHSAAARQGKNPP